MPRVSVYLAETEFDYLDSICGRNKKFASKQEFFEKAIKNYMQTNQELRANVETKVSNNSPKAPLKISIDTDNFSIDTKESDARGKNLKKIMGEN